MSTFAQLAALPKPGIAYLLDISEDNFSTYLYHWSTHAGVFGSYTYEDRITGVGNLSRGLGVNYTMASTSVGFTLDNTDGACDALVNYSQDAAAAGDGPVYLDASFRLSIVLFNPTAPTDYAVLALGQFACLNAPVRNIDTMKLSLADDLLTRAGGLATPPSLNDWRAATDTPANRPAAITSGPGAAPATDNTAVDWNAPLPIWFGIGPHQPMRVTNTIYVFCAVAEDRATAPATTGRLFDKDGYPAPLATPSGSFTVTKSCNITKGGKTWHLLFTTVALVSGTLNGEYVLSDLLKDPRYKEVIQALGTPAGTIAWPRRAEYARALDMLGPMQVRGTSWSQITDAGAATAAYAVWDLLTYYCEDPTAFSLNAASFATALAARPINYVNGTINPAGAQAVSDTTQRAFSPGDIAVALAGIAQVGGFDVVFGKDNVVYLKTLVQDFAAFTGTPTDIPDENLIEVTSLSYAGKGERYEPATRVFLTHGGTRFGPFIHQRYETICGRAFEKDIDVSWMSDAGDSSIAGGVPGYSAGVTVLGLALSMAAAARWVRLGGFDTVLLRPIVTFTTTLEVLALELGDYVTLTWSRGAAGGIGITNLSASKYRIEGLVLRPLDGVVEVQAVWADDAALGLYPYLLDDEGMTVRLAGGGGRTLTLTNGNSTVTFSSGDLGLDGVVAGDILVVRDSSEAATAFKRNRALLITSVGALTLDIDNGHGDGNDFGATTAGIADWNIYRGASTYHTAVSDPTNYPSGGAMYGKVSDSLQTDLFDDSTTANRLMDG